MIRLHTFNSFLDFCKNRGIRTKFEQLLFYKRCPGCEGDIAIDASDLGEDINLRDVLDAWEEFKVRR
ncbi:MAG: hypothetical protein ACE5H1_10160 [Thermodesulfobacteriota bacterium]